MSLPSWLCLLGQLETLRIDDNAFTNEWQPIVAPILANSRDNHNSLPPRSASQSNILRSHDSVASFASSQSSVTRDLATSGSAPVISSEGWMSPSTSADQSVHQLTGLGSIPEDHPRSAPLEPSKPMMQPLAPEQDLPPQRKGLRKMRSAGTLLNNSNSSPISPMLPGFGGKSQASPDILVPPSASRFGSFGGNSGRRAASVLGNVDSGSELSPPPRNNSLSTSTSAKTGKWGFLRKMSMHKQIQTSFPRTQCDRVSA